MSADSCPFRATQPGEGAQPGVLDHVLRLGVIGQYWDMAPHLHYTQLLNGSTARIAFNGTAINVHKNAPKDAAGNYPTQNLTSANCATGCTVQRASVGHAANATCEQGAGMRAVVSCRIPAKPEIPATTHYGQRVAAHQTSRPVRWAATAAMATIAGNRTLPCCTRASSTAMAIRVTRSGSSRRSRACGRHRPVRG